jgi:hypothetical protein
MRYNKDVRKNNTKLIERDLMQNYFSIEREGQQVDHVMLMDKNDNPAFTEVMDMSLEELKNYDGLEEMICSFMDATNELFEGEDEETFITLVDEDNVFIWSIVIGPSETEGDILYKFVDWKADGKIYKYAD